MRGIIISAGSATRLGSEAAHTPKGLLDINGESMLQRQIVMLRGRGISDVVVIVGPHRERYRLEGARYVKDQNHMNHDVLLSLMAARSEISGDVIVSYSDIIYDGDVLDAVMGSDADVGVATDPDWERGYEGRTEHPRSEADNVITKDGRITRIAKGISAGSGQENGEFIGMMRLSPRGSEALVREFERVEKEGPAPFHAAGTFEGAYLTDMLQEMIDAGMHITPVFIGGRWREVDTAQDLDRARVEFT